jgi:hypothetical protein
VALRLAHDIPRRNGPMRSHSTAVSCSLLFVMHRLYTASRRVALPPAMLMPSLCLEKWMMLFAQKLNHLGIDVAVARMRKRLFQ